MYRHVHVRAGTGPPRLLYCCNKARRRKPLSNVTASLSVAFKHNRRRKCHHLKGLLHFKTLAAPSFFPLLSSRPPSSCASSFIDALTQNLQEKQERKENSTGTRTQTNIYICVRARISTYFCQDAKLARGYRLY